MKQASTDLLEALTTVKVITAFQEWEEQKSQNGMFKSMMNYLYRVEPILLFIAATRKADLELHRQAGEALSKLFSAMDRIKYKRLWPRYIADMHDLRANHPQTWEELQAGSISVTKSGIPFVSLGADHACEQLNRLMKGQSGLIGISNNANARQRFFMVTPELTRLSKEFKSQFDMETDGTTEHHELGPSAIKRAHHAINKIKAAIVSHGNPSTAGGDKLYNIITHAYIPDEYVPQILNADVTGRRLSGQNATSQDARDMGITNSIATDPPTRKISLVDGMVLVQKLTEKPVTLVTVKDLICFFNDRLMSLNTRL